MQTTLFELPTCNLPHTADTDPRRTRRTGRDESFDASAEDIPKWRLPIFGDKIGWIPAILGGQADRNGHGDNWHRSGSPHLLLRVNALLVVALSARECNSAVLDLDTSRHRTRSEDSASSSVKLSTRDARSPTCRSRPGCPRGGSLPSGNEPSGELTGSCGCDAGYSRDDLLASRPMNGQLSSHSVNTH